MTTEKGTVAVEEVESTTVPDAIRLSRCHAVCVCICLMYMFEYDKRRNGNDNENGLEKVKFRGGAEVLIKRQIFIMLSVTFIALKFFLIFLAGISFV